MTASIKNLPEEVLYYLPKCSVEEFYSAVNGLPEANKTAIILHFIEQLKRQQIATELNWSVSKVNQKITRGITLLKQQLNPEYFRDADQIMEQTAQRLLSR